MNTKTAQNWKSIIRPVPILGPTVVGVWRSVRNIVQWWQLPNHDVTVYCLAGMRMIVRNPRKSFIGRALFVTGVWEPEVTEFISHRLRPGMTVVDVGADMGYYSLLFANKVGPTGKVIAFEPIPLAKALLDENIRINKLTNVLSYQFAISDRTGKAVLESPLKKSRVSLQKTQAMNDDIEIEIRHFDEWQIAMAIGVINMVKIDVEGAELMVLMGMRNTLVAQRPALLIEIHPDQLPHFGHTVKDLLTFLKDLDYEATPIDRPEMVFDLGNITVYWNKRCDS